MHGESSDCLHWQERKTFEKKLLFFLTHHSIIEPLNGGTNFAYLWRRILTGLLQGRRDKGDIPPGQIGFSNQLIIKSCALFPTCTI